ncbi:MAG: glycerophosphodiester phosphodiesterase [Acidimicrobiales bacterium]|jgi:glycerophosphoryl diester phosphodiesterase|nr:glycerophosphodiester phosphodiesterase [Acidimicrobiales bacterium]
MPRQRSVLVPPIGFAHRGASAHAPENTIDAFLLATRLGATGLESDVWLTADGQAVLDHDGVIGGRLRRRPIGTARRDELPPHIPTLADLYEACGPDLELSLDVKDERAAAEIVACARDVGAEARLWLCHPDRELVASWRELSPSVRLVHSTRASRLEGGPERHLARLSATGVDALNLHHSDWSAGLVAMVHRFELLALGWDVQFDRTIDNLLDTGIDGVFSDHVDRMMARIDRRHPT